MLEFQKTGTLTLQRTHCAVASCKNISLETHVCKVPVAHIGDMKHIPDFGHALVEFKNMRFLIMDRPSKANIAQFVKELKKCGVHEVVRVCEPTYAIDDLLREGITVLDWYYDDGAAPPREVVEMWLKLLKERFTDDPGTTIAIHCVAGLGRAPVLVALALIESGMKYEDAVDYIRRRRRGAINSKQLEYLENYKPTKVLRAREKNANCCIQ